MTLTVCINAQGLVYLQDDDDGQIIDLLADEYVARGDAAHGRWTHNASTFPQDLHDFGLYS